VVAVAAVQGTAVMTAALNDVVSIVLAAAVTAVLVFV